MFTIGLISILIGVLCVLWALKRQDDLDELVEELDKREVALDERANRISADEQTLSQEWLMLKKAKKELNYEKRFVESTDSSGH